MFASKVSHGQFTGPTTGVGVETLQQLHWMSCVVFRITFVNRCTISSREFRISVSHEHGSRPTAVHWYCCGEALAVVIRTSLEATRIRSAVNSILTFLEGRFGLCVAIGNEEKTELICK